MAAKKWKAARKSVRRASAKKPRTKSSAPKKPSPAARPVEPEADAQAAPVLPTPSATFVF
jgi:hypothetical protein